METYIERVNQFVVEYQTQLTPCQAAQLRIAGGDPDNLWSLKWSFTTADQAAAVAAQEQASHDEFCQNHGCERFKTYRSRDLGSAQTFERAAWF